MAERHPGPRTPRPTGQTELPLYAAPLSVVLDRLASGEDGLPEDEATRRLGMVGQNHISASDRRPASSVLAGELWSIEVVLLLAAATVAWVTGHSLEAAAIGVALTLHLSIRVFAELRSRRFADAVLRRSRREAVVLRSGQPTRVDAAHLVPGDVIEVRAGERVPADARLLVADGLWVGEGILAGDETPVEKAASPPPSAGTPLRDRTSMLFSGSTVTQGRARAMVTATGIRTASGRLGRAEGEVDRRMTSLEARVEDVGRRLTWVGSGLAGAAVAVGVVRGSGSGLTLESAITLLLAAVPEALPLVIAFVLAVTVHRMARRGVPVSHPGAVESLGTASVVCADGEETLTSGPPWVTRVVTPSARATVAGAAGERPPRLQILPATASAETEVETLLRVAAMTLDGGPSANGAGDHSLTRALRELVRAGGIEPAELLRAAPAFAFVPRDAAHPMSAWFRHEETGPSGIVRGAPDAVLGLCGSTVGPEGTRQLDERSRARIQADARALAAEGFRVVAFARHAGAVRIPDLRGSSVFLGMVALEEAPAPGIGEAVAELGKAGIRPVFLLDEGSTVGKAMARKAGVEVRDDESVDLDRLSGPGALLRVAPGASVFGGVGPDGGRRVVEALRAQGDVVVAVDEEACSSLGTADVSVALGGRNGGPTESGADVVLEEGGFPAVLDAIREGRIAFANVRRSITYLLGCAFAAVLVVVSAMALGWPLPLLPLQVLWLDWVMVALPALALAVEPAAPDVMTRPRERPGVGILSRREVASLSGYAVLMACAALTAFIIALGARRVEHAVTVGFTTLALASLFQLANVRVRATGLPPGPAITNPWAVGAVGTGLVLQTLAVYWTPLSEALGTVPLGITDWAWALGLAAIPALVGRVAGGGRMTWPAEFWRPRQAAGVPALRDEAGPGHAVLVFDDTPAARGRGGAPASNGTGNPWTLARAAVEAGDLPRLKELVRRHPDLVRGRDDEGTLLHHATGMPTLSWPPAAPDMITLLVEAGADPNAGERADDSGETPLIYAVSVNNFPVARRLLELGADPERHGRYPEQKIDTALGYALLYGQDPWFGVARGDCVQLLLNRGAVASLPLAAALGRDAFVAERLPDASPDDGVRALVFAAHRGQAGVVRTCLEAGVDGSKIISFFHQRVTPLLAAAGQGHLDAVQVLLDAGVEAELPEGALGSSAMTWAWTRSVPGPRRPR